MMVDRKIFKDSDFILFTVNAGLVIFGYGLALYTDNTSVTFMKILKSFFLITSLTILLTNVKLNNRIFSFPSMTYIGIFCFWIIFMSFFSEKVWYSLSRAMDFMVPFIYVYLLILKLTNKYSPETVINAFIRGFNIIYSIPVLTYVFLTRNFTVTNIYGFEAHSGVYFYSNQFGWSGAMFLLTSLDIMLNIKISKGYLYFLLPLFLADLYLVLITGNRSSWVGLLLSCIVFIFRMKRLRADFKILSLIIPIILIYWLVGQPGSSLNNRWTTTSNQIDNGEEREEIFQEGFDKFNENKSLWLTGVGMFNTSVIIHDRMSDYHNSYLEILFGGGIILFILFLIFILFRPFIFYLKFYSKYFLVLPPLMVIPLFESNLTGGQFLFYPWFAFMFLFNIDPKKFTSKKEVRRVKVSSVPKHYGRKAYNVN